MVGDNDQSNFDVSSDVYMQLTWCLGQKKIVQLLDDLDVACETTNADAMQSTMARVNQFFQVRYGGTSKAHSTKIATTQAKAVATKLESSVLRQRQLAKQHLESHKSVQPVKVSKPVIVATEPTLTVTQRASNLGNFKTAKVFLFLENKNRAHTDSCFALLA